MSAAVGTMGPAAPSFIRHVHMDGQARTPVMITKPGAATVQDPVRRPAPLIIRDAADGPGPRSATATVGDPVGRKIVRSGGPRVLWNDIEHAFADQAAWLGSR